MRTQQKSDTAIAAAIREYVERYYALIATLESAQNSSKVSAPQHGDLGTAAIGQVPRKEDAPNTFSFSYYLQRARSDPGLNEAVSLAWFSSAVLHIGELLAAHRYFDRSPELELFRHIRNGLAHGNVFRIADGVDFHRFPADNLRAASAVGTKKVFSVVRSLTGKRVLFDFMAPGDVLDLMVWIAQHIEALPARSTDAT